MDEINYSARLAELVDALRKRRNRPDASDEDLGLPRSPTTPQRKDNNAINQSEGSLSLLSMVSSDMEDESLVTSIATVTHNISSNHSFTSSSKLSSQNTSQNSDEIDFLDASMSSTGSRLSHSAARHKIAIRPKKKGPTRHRTPKDTNILPSTPEVNEDSQKMSLLDVTTTTSVKHKSHSLPPGMNAKMLEKHATSIANTHDDTVDSSTKFEHQTKTSTNSSSTTTLTANKNLSKSFDFNNSKDHTQTISITTNTTTSTTTMSESKSDDVGFFKRLLNRSTKKKKDSDEPGQTTDDSGDWVIVPKLIVETKPYETPTITCSPLNTYLPVDVLPPGAVESKPKPSLPKTDKPRSGPASRQRVHPQEISTSPKPDLLVLSNDNKAIAPITIINNTASTNELSKSTEKLPPKSPKKSPSSQDSVVKTFGYSPKPINKIILTGLVTASESKTEDDEPPPAIPSSPYECRYIKAHQYRRNFTEDTFHSLSPPKASSTYIPIDEWTNRSSSKLSSILSKIDSSKTDLSAQQLLQSSPKRKSVEKSKSFRVYTENCADKELLLNANNNMPSLPDLSYDRCIEKPKFLSVKPDLGRTFREISHSVDSKFVIHDNNLIRPKDDKHLHNSSLAGRKSIILDTSKSPTTAMVRSSQNITQIEDNIDKIMKSSLVTVLKKSSTSDLMEIKSSSKSNTNNVSITSINSVDSNRDDEIGRAIDLWQTTDKDSGGDLSSTSNSPSSTPSRKFIGDATVTSGRIPEFLKIQLNRTDSTAGAASRPKSHIILSKYQKDENDENDEFAGKKQRRFSDDSVDIAIDTKPPKSPPQPKHKTSITNLTKSTESVTTTPTSPTKGSYSPTLSASSMSDIRKSNAATEPSHHQQHGVIIERRKSVSDEKLKFEKKIEEMKNIDRVIKRPPIASIDDHSAVKSNEFRKSSMMIDDENVVVVLRKKSFSQSNAMNKSSSLSSAPVSSTGSGGGNKEDTPELMKVFARRSLKLKDSDDFHVYDTQSEKLLKTKSLNLDSDKENQSSSEEKLDKISPKVETNVQSKINNNNNHNNNNNTNALKPKENDDKLQRKENDATKSEFRRNCIITPKPLFIGPNKLSTNYRNTTSFMDAHKVYTATVTSSSSTLSENNNNNNNGNNNNSGIGNGNNNNNNNSARHTINASTMAANNGECSAKTNNSEESEFKGILQRRAEWEKRAKEALK